MTLSTNGFLALPRDGFEDVAIGNSIFGGKLDDELRAIKRGDTTLAGLFDTALSHYRQDSPAFFVFAITENGLARSSKRTRTGQAVAAYYTAAAAQ